ncbi:MAG: 4-(cytidine 5'-diphospho)-2-C-methyl-D-erythritol kinase [Clostridium sp.]|jgi:4-diphosphocytidyl-2-C-methyl-D-erythritol kinase|nr:4-(cytidine 5'-diphospho)-2-C-methyl-D-erythritol kinase [Clostridium sp.]
MESYDIRAYAKINLGLDVLRRLENGYHEVKMVMQTVGIYDELALRRTVGGITLAVDTGEIPADGNNLAHKAAKCLMEKYGISEGIRIRLKKRIPVAAGMAGGSSDAAAVLLGMNRLFGLGLSGEELRKLAVGIGADVPYGIMGGTALAEGIGEKLTALNPAPDCYVLVAKPGIRVSTRRVYEQLRLPGPWKPPDIDGMVAAIGGGDLEGMAARMGNVLESVTAEKYPVIRAWKRRLLELGACNSLMSGSGPTVFGVFAEEAAAGKAYEVFLEETSCSPKDRKGRRGEQIFLTKFRKAC